MKVRMAVLSASVISLAACASTGEQAGYAPEAQRAYVQTRIAPDDLYIARVEAIARRRGIDLTWVNAPTKIVAKQE